MRSLLESGILWTATFAQSSNLSDLRAAVGGSTSSSPCNLGLRSICWKAFLLFENLDQSTWPKTLQDSRGAYLSLKEHFLRNVENPDDLSATDPLADDENSPWNTLRRDETLRAEIFQDIERCMPENLYFREPSTQSALLDILFIYCKLNADIGYRQGMHEVLAPILWVVSRDAVDPATLNGTVHNESDKLLRLALDHDYVEHDAFTIFCIIMQTVKSFYEMGSTVQQSVSAASASSPIVERSKRIHEDYLQKTDPELTKHLTTIEILPQIFVIRWIRLLFGREFPFDDVLSLWDVLFAEDPGLDLVDYVCLGMLLRIRWQLLQSDYTSALTLLLRYPVPPEPHGPTSFVDDAVYLKRHLTLKGGNHIVCKYSGRSLNSHPSIDHGSSPRNSMEQRRGSEGKEPSLTWSPIKSPTQILYEQGGIEGILQEAARGVYSRSEKWGVSKALRGAVQGLQSGNSSPRKGISGIRWSLDDGKVVPSNEDQLALRIKNLEERSKALASLLQNAMDDLSEQQMKFEKDDLDESSNALTLTIAKLQFVQVYLRDPSVPLVSDAAPPDANEHREVPGIVGVSQQQALSHPAAGQTDKKSTNVETNEANSAEVRFKPPSTPPPGSKTARPLPISTQENTKEKPLISPFQHPRPSLASSSFSWMLGEDRSKSNFVSVDPFSPERRRGKTARGSVGFLFGEENFKGAGQGVQKGKEAAEDDDGFTLGTLRGVPKGLEQE